MPTHKALIFCLLCTLYITNKKLNFVKIVNDNVKIYIYAIFISTTNQN